MKRLSLILAGALALSTGFTALAANSDAELKAAVDARQAHMKLYGKNLGVLGGMLKGEVAYDAATAQAAADKILELSTADQSGFWLPGTDSDSYKETRAKPEIWTADSTAGAKGKALVVAAQAMAKTAGQGVDGIKAGMGGVGGACSACHKAYRVPKE